MAETILALDDPTVSSYHSAASEAAAAFSETFPELVAALDLGADYDHDSQFTDTEDGIEIYESASASDGELELYLKLSTA